MPNVHARCKTAKDCKNKVPVPLNCGRTVHKQHNDTGTVIFNKLSRQKDAALGMPPALHSGKKCRRIHVAGFPASGKSLEGRTKQATDLRIAN